MLNRIIRRPASEVQWPSGPLRLTFLAPRYMHSTTTIVESAVIPESLQKQTHASPALHSTAVATEPPSPQSSTPSTPSSPSRTEAQPSSSQPNETNRPPLHPSIRTLLPLLKAQPSHYITAHIHARPYLLTVGDTLRLPFHMPRVVPGDILRLTKASIIGSRDYTLKGAPYLDERLFECRARVMGVDSDPMRIEERTMRRQRKVKYIKSKHKYTILRLAELKIRDLEEVER